MATIEGNYLIRKAPGKPGDASVGDKVRIEKTDCPDRYSVTVCAGDSSTPRSAWDQLPFDFEHDLEGCLCQLTQWNGETHPHVMVLQVEQISDVRIASCRVISLEAFNGGTDETHGSVQGSHATGSWHGSNGGP